MHSSRNGHVSEEAELGIPYASCKNGNRIGVLFYGGRISDARIRGCSSRWVFERCVLEAEVVLSHLILGNDSFVRTRNDA